MIPFLADEDFNGRIVRGLMLREAEIDIVRVQDVDLSGADDPAILAWAAVNGRAILTHDLRTMPGHAATRISQNLPVVGVFVVDDLAGIGSCIDDIILVAQCSLLDEWRDQIYYLPIK